MNTFVKIVCVVAGLFAVNSLWAQKMDVVEAGYTFVIPDDMPPAKAMQVALQHAQLKAIADTYGTVVGITDVLTMTESDTKMLSFGETEVKGEWIETIGEPEFIRSVRNNHFLVTARVKGRIREIVMAEVEFEAKILRNGYDDKFESEEFKDGDDLYLSFRSPVDGYLTVYLYDGADDVYCLLPYSGQSDGNVKVKAKKRHLIFSSRHPHSGIKSHLIDEYTMTCTKPMEHNRLYVIFSPNMFTKALDNASSEEALPRVLSFQDFQKWLTKCRKRDLQMCVDVKTISISKN